MRRQSTTIYPVSWQGECIALIDQTCLPQDYVVRHLHRADEVAEAIRTMRVRGAPALGVAVAYGLYLGARPRASDDHTTFLEQLEAVAEQLRQTRPTAVNLNWALQRSLGAARQATGSPERMRAAVLEAAHAIQAQDLRTCQAIGRSGCQALPERPQQLSVLTHCNTGSLATASHGTALGVVRSLWQSDRLARVYATETRPRLQGARLTAWECVRDGLPATVIADGAAAHCMQQGQIDAVVVGADRIARNGDTANKIGTYALAVLARAHGVPFWVAAPLSSVDWTLAEGSQIPIEQRPTAELKQIGDMPTCPPAVDCYNPAFDITPAELITGIITEWGAVAPHELATLEPAQAPAAERGTPAQASA
ncbi:MAG: S-methyl-5-thioribose-1-phosphate isomerase [Cyanobacteria bacterium QS_8_64_29]|nr:MAG: S-methyl-5-thioribose-1-phosphate isomerase [Cyanobacteria bacterium QS_8_64_29]